MAVCDHSDAFMIFKRRNLQRCQPFLTSLHPGWGSTASCPVAFSSVLLEVEVPIVSDTVCEAASSDSVTISQNGQCVTEAHNYTGVISSDMVCAGASGKGSCVCDGGGPLTVKNNSTNKHDLVGVFSWGYGCAAVSIFISLTSLSSVNINFIPGWPLWSIC